MQNYEHECDRYKEQLFDYVSDILTDEERAAVELHIGSCQRCAKELEEIRAILGAAAALAEPEVPEELRTAVSERLMHEEKSIRLKKRRFVRAAQIAVPFAACAALAIGIYSGGLYDRYMKSDNMISSGENISVTQNGDISATDNTDTEQISDIPETDAVEVTPNTASNKKVQSKNTTADTAKAKVSPSETAPAVEEKDGIGNLPAVTSEKAAPVKESAQDANVPMVASADDMAAYSVARSVETDMAIPECAEETEEASANEDAAGGGSAVSGGGGAAAKSKKTDNPPASCTIVTDDPYAFASGFGKELTDGAFVLQQDEWKAFVEYVRGNGAQLDADFSGEYNGQTTVVVKN